VAQNNGLKLTSPPGGCRIGCGAALQLNPVFDGLTHREMNAKRDRTRGQRSGRLFRRGVPCTASSTRASASLAHAVWVPRITVTNCRLRTVGYGGFGACRAASQKVGATDRVLRMLVMAKHPRKAIHSREAKRPSNNGLKLTARGASVEARQLNPVLDGQTVERERPA
jgi:hypothetical protein